MVQQPLPNTIKLVTLPMPISTASAKAFPNVNVNPQMFEKMGHYSYDKKSHYYLIELNLT